MVDKNDYENRPAHYALELVDNCSVSAESMLSQCFAYMSEDEIRQMLDENEWSPRFMNDDDDDDEESATDEISYRDCGLW